MFLPFYLKSFKKPIDLLLCCVIIESSKGKQKEKEDITLNDTQRNYETLLEAIETNNISAEELLNAFTNWHGLQLIDDDFIEFLEDEGII